MNDVGFAIYHYRPGQWNALRPQDPPESAFINHCRAWDAAEAGRLREQGQTAWIYVNKPFDDRTQTAFKDGWEAELAGRVEAIQAAGAWEAVAGFEFEELCMGLTAEQFIQVTRYIADRYPDKRRFAVLSYYEVVEGSAPDNFTITPMTPDTYRYITDIGFDWYSNTDDDRHRELTARMLWQTGRDDLRVWFFPCTFTSMKTVDEAFMIDHLDMCYRLLQEQKHPGGLYCYTWKTWNEDSIALDRVIDPAGDYRYERLAARMIAIGREIGTMKGESE